MKLQNYVEEKRNKIQSEIVLIAFDLNKYFKVYKNEPNRFQSFLNTQNLVRDIDQLFLINSNGDLILSANNSKYSRLKIKQLEWSEMIIDLLKLSMH